LDHPRRDPHLVEGSRGEERKDLAPTCSRPRVLPRSSRPRHRGVGPATADGWAHEGHRL